VASAYWMLESPRSAGRPEVREFVAWVLAQAAETRHQLSA
jgi:hypothetical protein